ncbi:MAG: hypothetical protein WKG00_17480 [Polyangiaceae bacterium]
MLNVWKITTLASTLALGLVVGGGSVESAFADVQPKMHVALAKLKEARAALDTAATDKGGHRRAALAATDSAIAEVKKGIEFDNQHPGEK